MIWAAILIVAFLFVGLRRRPPGRGTYVALFGFVVGILSLELITMQPLGTGSYAALFGLVVGTLSLVLITLRSGP